MFAHAIQYGGPACSGRAEATELARFWRAMTGAHGGAHRGRGRHRERGWGQGWGRGFPGEGPFGPGRKARRGDIRMAALLLLAEEPRNGSQNMQEVEQRSEGVWGPSP